MDAVRIEKVFAARIKFIAVRVVRVVMFNTNDVRKEKQSRFQQALYVLVEKINVQMGTHAVN